MKVTPVISDFTRGELSPRMEGRSDAQEFYQGVRELKNMIVLPQGGVEKRPGTRYFSAAQNADKKSRLIPFVLSEETKYLLELYDGGVNVIDTSAPESPQKVVTQYVMTLDVAPATDWGVGRLLTGQTSGASAYILQKNSGTEWVITEPDGTFTLGEVLRARDADGNNVDADQGAAHPTVATATVTDPVYEKSSETWYTEAQLFNVKYVQAEAQMAFVHPEHPPKILTYYSQVGWVWSQQDIDVPAFVPSNTSEVLTGTDGVVARTPFADQPTVTIVRPSNYKVGDVVKYTDGKYYRCIQDAPSTTDPSGEGTNWEEITLGSGSPFDAAGKYPSSVAYFQDRLIYAGAIDAPATVWMSGVAKYNYFIVGPNAADPLSIQFLSERNDKVQWLTARDVVIAGTLGSEWVIGGGQNGITPTSVFARRQTNFGSGSVQGKLINQNVVFVQKGNRKLREYTYFDQTAAYQAADLTFFADHITESGVVEMGFQSNPDPILWVVLHDGRLIGLTYDKTRGIEGWHDHNTDGEIESMAIVPADDEDRLWLVVKRTINGETVRYLEYMESRYQNRQRDLYYVDAGTTVDAGEAFAMTAATAADPVSVTATAHGLTTGDLVRMTDVSGMTELEGRTFFVTVTDANTFTLDNEDGTGRAAATGGTCEPVVAQATGLTWLEGETVSLSVDGGPAAQRTVSSGTVTLDAGTYGNVIHVGLPYTARLKTMNIMSAMTDAKMGRINQARIRFIDTIQAHAGPDEQTLEEIIFRESTTPYGQSTQLFTGEKSVSFASPYADDQRVVIQSSQPTPLTVAVILPETGVYAGGR